LQRHGRAAGCQCTHTLWVPALLSTTILHHAVGQEYKEPQQTRSAGLRGAVAAKKRSRNEPGTACKQVDI
jgi:hypothetical protein